MIAIRSMKKGDWIDVEHIYRLGIETGIATFEDSTPGWEAWDKKHHQFARLVVIQNEKIVGWCALFPVSNRHAYRGVAEITIYIHPDFQRRGIGRKLMAECISHAENHGIWTIQAVIFEVNKPSIALHQKLGFRTVGFRERIGQKNGVWTNTVLMERRSKKIGIE